MKLKVKTCTVRRWLDTRKRTTANVFSAIRTRVAIKREGSLSSKQNNMKKRDFSG